MAIISSVVLVVAAYESIIVPEAREYGLFASIASAACAALDGLKSYINSHLSRIRKNEKSAA